MTKIFIGFVFFAAAFAGEKKPPQGHGENDAVAVSATFITTDQVKEEFGSTFNGNFTVVEVRLVPKGGKPMDVRLDDFILRSQSDGDHSGPLLAAQIVDGAALVVRQTYARGTNPESAPMIAGTKVEMKNDLSKGTSGTPEVLAALKKRILEEKTTSEPESGLLFFPMEHEKPKSLVLSYTSPGGRMRIEFK